MILVDASVWIDLYNGKDTRQVDRLIGLLQGGFVAITDLTIVEVLQGSRSDAGFDDALRLFSRLELVEIGGREVAVQAARHYRALRGRGVTVRKTVDTLIATRCIMDGHALLFSDRDFEPFLA